MMQISLIVCPIIVAGGLGYMLLFRGATKGLAIVGLAGFVLLVNLIFAWLQLRRIRHFPVVLGRIWNYTHPDDFQTSHMTILQYSFEIDGQGYEGEHLLAGGPKLPIGSPLWILYNPKSPADSVPWLDDSRAG